MALLLTYLVGVEMESELFGYLPKVTWGSGEPMQKSKSLPNSELFSKG